VPNRRIGLVNVVFVCKNKMSCVRVVSAGGEEKSKGRKAVDFEQGTRVDGTFATMKEGLPAQVSRFLILIKRKDLPSQICTRVCSEQYCSCTGN
jgi:hypothetical protein